MLLMRPVNGNAFLAISMILAGNMARAMIFILILFSKFGCKFILKPMSFLFVTFVKFGHSVDFLLIPVNNHHPSLLLGILPVYGLVVSSTCQIDIFSINEHRCDLSFLCKS